jgi:hypothetical protein
MQLRYVQTRLVWRYIQKSYYVPLCYGSFHMTSIALRPLALSLHSYKLYASSNKPHKIGHNRKAFKTLIWPCSSWNTSLVLEINIDWIQSHSLCFLLPGVFCYRTNLWCWRHQALCPYLLASKHLRRIQQTNSVAWVRERTIPSDRRLSAKWLLTFADRGCHVASVTDPYVRILGFLDRSRYFSINCTHEAEWTPFQTHSEKSGSGGNRIRASGSVLKNSDH